MKLRIIKLALNPRQVALLEEAVNELLWEYRDHPQLLKEVQDIVRQVKRAK